MTSVTTHADRRVLRRLALGVLGVAALVVCLLALNHGAGYSASGSSKVAVAAQTAPSPDQVTTSARDRGTPPLSREPCGVACAPTLGVVAVACLLVVQVAVALLVADLILTRRSLLHQILVDLAAKAAALAPPAPPSLVVLSISRT